MIDQGSGAIVITASMMAFVALPKFSAYCAAKGGLIQLARSLAVDYSPKGIRVNVIAPGAINTQALIGEHPPELIEDCIKLTLLGCLGEPEDIAKTALFLASDDSSYITGSVVTVDGGCLARLG